MLVNPEQLFAWAGALIAPCWLLLAASLWLPRLERATQWLAKLGLPIVFGALYSAALQSHVPFDAGGFGSLSSVRALFQNDCFCWPAGSIICCSIFSSAHGSWPPARRHGCHGCSLSHVCPGVSWRVPSACWHTS